MKPYKHILVALDLSDYTEQLMKRAMELATVLGDTVSLVHVVEPIPAYSFGYLGVEDLEEQVTEHAKNSVKRFSERFSVPEEACHVLHGSTKGEICKLIDDKKADLLMVGSHGRHGIQALLGSTASALLNAALCDVMSVRLEED